MAKGKYKEWLTPEGLIRLEGWARDGLTDEQIAKNMGISTATLYNWKRNHFEILEALKKGKEVIDREVENALLKKALGYMVEEVTEEMSANGKVIIRKKRVRCIPPDTTALIFWLKNRKPEQWRDKPPVIEVNDNDMVMEFVMAMQKGPVG